MVIVRFQKGHALKALPSSPWPLCNREGQVLLPSCFVKIVIVWGDFCVLGGFRETEYTEFKLFSIGCLHF